jgi:hypothetical protein
MELFGLSVTLTRISNKFLSPVCYAIQYLPNINVCVHNVLVKLVTKCTSKNVLVNVLVKNVLVIQKFASKIY